MTRLKESHPCSHCGIQTRNEYFCSHKCRAAVIHKPKTATPRLSRLEKRTLDYQTGQVTYRATLRKIIAKERGYKCSVCEISEWQGQTITLVVDHVDGNAGNNMPDNLRLICPNCNSQTDTFGGRNKGNGRKTRGLRLN